MYVSFSSDPRGLPLSDGTYIPLVRAGEDAGLVFDVEEKQHPKARMTARFTDDAGLTTDYLRAVPEIVPQQHGFHNDRTEPRQRLGVENRTIGDTITGGARTGQALHPDQRKATPATRKEQPRGLWNPPATGPPAGPPSYPDRKIRNCSAVQPLSQASPPPA